MIKAVQAAENGQNRPLGRPPKQRDQRNRILREAAQIIARVGYEKCSLARIAKGLGLSAPALYHYFPTKQSIFSEIAMFVVCGIYDYVREGLESDASPGEQLRVMMRRHAAYFDDQYWMMNATIAGYAGIARRDIQAMRSISRPELKNPTAAGSVKQSMASKMLVLRRLPRVSLPISQPKIWASAGR